MLLVAPTLIWVVVVSSFVLVTAAHPFNFWFKPPFSKPEGSLKVYRFFFFHTIVQNFSSCLCLKGQLIYTQQLSRPQLRVHEVSWDKTVSVGHQTQLLTSKRWDQAPRGLQSNFPMAGTDPGCAFQRLFHCLLACSAPASCTASQCCSAGGLWSCERRAHLAMSV